MLKTKLSISALVLVHFICTPYVLHAQTSVPTRTAISAADRMAREIELKETERQLQLGAEARRKYEADLSLIRSDRAKLLQKTIDLASSIKTIEARISMTEERMSVLLTDEDKISNELEARRAVIVNLLSGLQRIGQLPPPIVLADPDDLLSTVRGAMMLGAALPELSEESRKLSVELDKKTFIRKAIEDEQQSLSADVAKLVDERLQLSLALEARQRDETVTQDQISDQAAAVAVLAAKSQTLKDLLGHAESELGAVVQATDAAKEATAQAEADARTAAADGKTDERAKLAANAFGDPSRIAPKVAFSELKGLLKQPVAGSVIRSFNEKDQLGNPVKGVSVQTRSGAMISAPSDAWVSYAGPFRSFGQLLILNTGGGYYILLAGMDRITVGLGQFVLAGEPIAVMAGTSGVGTAAASPDMVAPTLYIEFRKDGTPFDPASWWAPGSFEKVKE